MNRLFFKFKPLTLLTLPGLVRSVCSDRQALAGKNLLLELELIKYLVYIFSKVFLAVKLVPYTQVEHTK